MNKIYNGKIPRDLTEKLDVFDPYKFFEKGHYYTYFDKKVEISMTKLIHDYSKEFEAEKMAAKKSEKEDKWIQEVLDEWKKENVFSTVKGSHCHLFAQEIWKNHVYEINYSKIEDDIDKKRLKESFESIKKQATNFYHDYKDILVPIADEFIVGSDLYDIAGSIDNLFFNVLTHGIVLVDYKTNKEIKYKGFRNATMKVPLQHLQDCNYIHYCIQLNGYQKLFEDKTGLKISEKFIVYFNDQDENYKIIEVENLTKEVNEILENRRVKNMKSVPVLIIGKSGSGKSTSLRNFKEEELGLINVLGKPLPFKSNLKFGVTDNYETIINAIKNTDKKVIVIDDAGYLITNEFMRKAKQTGFQKFTEMGQNFWNLIQEIKNLDGGKTVYLTMHEESINDVVRPKTIGKLLDDNVCIEGMFTVVLRSMCENGKYIFRTKTNGQDVAKTPFDMFQDSEIENDLKKVDQIIRNYYELDEKKEEEVAEK